MNDPGNASPGLISADSINTAAPRDPPREFAHALGEILVPNEGGEVRFGAQNEMLRLSQVEALTAVRDCVESNGKIGHIVQPGGTGKTREGIVAAHAMHRHGRNTLYVVPSQQAIQDFANKARKLCPDLDVGTVYQVEKRIGRLTFITYASLLRCILGKSVETEAHEFEEQQLQDIQSAQPSVNGRSVTIDPREYDLVIWDEAHKYLTAHAQQLVGRFPHALSVALTATPRYYEGKEVAHVFGNRLHELDLQTAIERKEVSDFRNLLITTDVTTGLCLSSPDQEESAKVARAIDLPHRNRIFPDMYKNTVIEVERKKFTLTGEPTIVFGASIEHVHDLASAFNEMLTPLLQSDEEFRAALRAKGVDPDTVEQIAAPIHSNGSGEREPMSLGERNATVERYDQRKVLVLVATSVLQQSFDSPITSIVIDSVPRQTYVGVGQAGMRALRYLASKEMAFIINTQDVDHPSLTFLDFQAARGREEGVTVEIGSIKGTGARRTTAGSNAAVHYNVTYGAALVDLAMRRRAQGERLYRDDYETSFRPFTPLGFQRVNQLIVNMANGDQGAVRALIGEIQPWIARTHQRIALQVFGEENIDEEACASVQIDTLAQLIGMVQSGGIQGWSRFSARFQQDLRHRYEKLQRNSGRLPTVSLDEEVSYKHVQSHLQEDDPQEIVAINEPTQAPLHDTIPSTHDYDPASEAHAIQRREKVEQVLQTLSYREREILKLRYGLGNGYTYTLEEIGKIFKVTGENVRRIEAKAIRKMQHPVRSRQLKGYVEGTGERPLAILMRQEVEEANEKQRKLNNRILWEIEDELVAQKKVIFDMLKCGDGEGHVPTRTVFETTKVPEHLVKALSDLEWTRVHDLVAALDNRVIAQLRAGLPQLGVTPQKIAAFDQAIEELQGIMERYTEMGGKPAKT